MCKGIRHAPTMLAKVSYRLLSVCSCVLAQHKPLCVQIFWRCRVADLATPQAENRAEPTWTKDLQVGSTPAIVRGGARWRVGRYIQQRGLAQVSHIGPSGGPLARANTLPSCSARSRGFGMPAVRRARWAAHAEVVETRRRAMPMASSGTTTELVAQTAIVGRRIAELRSQTPSCLVGGSLWVPFSGVCSASPKCPSQSHPDAGGKHTECILLRAPMPRIHDCLCPEVGNTVSGVISSFIESCSRQVIVSSVL